VQPLLQWKSNEHYILLVCYPACNAHAPYCHLRPVTLYSIFPHYFINGMIFERKKSYWTQNVCFDILYTFFSETFLIPRRTERVIIIYVEWSSCKVPVILVQLWWSLKLLDSFSTNTQISNFMKIRPMGGESFHSDRRTDMTKLRVAFRNFANAPKSKCYNCIKMITKV
jgi:hypothetical protein